MGYAPTLFCFTRISELRSVVVMEYVTGEGLHEFMEKSDCSERKAVLKQLKEVVTSLHTSNFCHGDLRAPNILIKAGPKVCVLDFEWSGCLGGATYPFFMNHRDIKWPEGAQDGNLITTEHDKYWLSTLVDKYSTVAPLHSPVFET